MGGRGSLACLAGLLFWGWLALLAFVCRLTACSLRVTVGFGVCERYGSVGVVFVSTIVWYATSRHGSVWYGTVRYVMVR